MVAPLLLAGGYVAASTGGSVLSSLISSYVGPVIAPITRTNTYNANKASPNVWLSFDQLLEIYLRGGCTRDEFYNAAQWDGVRLIGAPDGSANQTWWRRFVEVATPQLPIEMAIKSTILGHRNQDQLEYTIKRSGFRTIADWHAIINDSAPLPLDLILTLWWKGIINDNDVDKYLRHAGFRDDDILNLVKQQSNPVSIPESLILWNRGVIGKQDVIDTMNWIGIRQHAQQDRQMELRWQWPSLGQIVQWSQVGALDEQYAQNLQLDAEQPDLWDTFARSVGAKWTGDDQAPRGWPTPDTSPADYAWRAHWRPNDIATAITMLHRLRPTGGVNGGPRIDGVKPYTEDDFARDMGANLIPPGRRDQFKAVTYSLPRFTMFRTAYDAGVIDKQEIVESIQDAGFSPKTGQMLADTWEHMRIQSQIDKIRPISVSQIKDAYRIGTISRQQAAASLYFIYLDDYLKQQDFLTLPPNEQLVHVQTNPWVNAALTAIDADIAGELAKQAIEVIRKGYLRLEITATEATDQLSRLGIVIQRAQQYVQLWTYEHAVMGIEATASQLRDWYLNHLIDQPTYSTRLALLGYSTGDIALMVARANLDLSEQAAKLQAQTVKAQQMQAKQLQAAAKALAQQQKQVRKAMCSSGTRKQVATWAVKGWLDYPDAWKRLQDCGMTPDDAVNFLTESQPKKGGLTHDEVQSKVGQQPSSNGVDVQLPAQ